MVMVDDICLRCASLDTKALVLKGLFCERERDKKRHPVRQNKVTVHAHFWRKMGREKGVKLNGTKLSCFSTALTSVFFDHHFMPWGR